MTPSRTRSAARARRARVPKLLDVVREPGTFARRVLSDFRKNGGLLLAGAVAYNSLLSIVPLFALVLLVLSAFVDRERLLTTLAADLALIVPEYSGELLAQITALLDHGEVVSGVVVVVLLAFSAIAFGVLESSMARIFHHRPRHGRHLVVSLILPYAFIALLGVGLLLVTFVAGAFERLESRAIPLFGWSWSLEGASGVALYVLGVIGQVMMLTAFYLVMPVGKIAFRHALLGGVLAGVAWELTRHVLVWYFSTLSLVNLVYGSIAGTVVVLLTFEVGALILLLGAQVVAEFERHPAAPD